MTIRVEVKPMAYNKWLSAAPQVGQEDLLHYGVVGMKWGVRKAQYYKRKADSLGMNKETVAKKLEYLTKYNDAVERFRTKSRARLYKYDTRFRKYQDTANRYFIKSDKKLSGLIKDYHGAGRANRRMEKFQRKAIRESDKELRFYKEMINSYKALKIDPDDDLVQKGKEIVRRSDIFSMTLYSNAMMSKGKKLKHEIGFEVVTSYLGNEVVEGFDLVHHGVKGQRKGVQNGPPYPLYRQDRFSKNGKSVDPETYKRVQAKASGSGGHANPSTYKKTKSEIRTEKKAIRKANPNGTPQDQKEKDSLLARIKRANREKVAQRKQEQQADEERKAKSKAALDRLMNSDLPDEEKQRILNGLSNADFDGTLGLDSGRYLKGHGPISKGYPNPEYIDNAINAYHQKVASEREAAKQHGTADDVMKFRESFTTEEWNDIARRLEAEAKVMKYLSRPVERPSQDNQNDSSRSSSSSDKDIMRGLSSDEKKIFLTGDARTVYTNRTKFTPEQLRTINNRLDAEDKIGKFANNQISLDSSKYLKFKNAVKWIETAGKGAQGLYNIAKLIDPTIGDGKKNSGPSNSTNNLIKALDGIAKALDGNSGGSKQQNKNKNKNKNK